MIHSTQLTHPPPGTMRVVDSESVFVVSCLRTGTTFASGHRPTHRRALEQRPARSAHTAEVEGSNPSRATNFIRRAVRQPTEIACFQSASIVSGHLER